MFASKATHQQIGGGKIMLVSKLIVDISKKLSKDKVAKQAVPEQYPLLRTIQFVMEYRLPVFEALNIKKDLN